MSAALGRIDEVIEQFRSKHSNILTSIGNLTSSRVRQYIPSGCAVLDALLGGWNGRKGALGTGRIYEIYSSESKGKSTIAEHFEASVQMMGGVAIRINSESAHDPVRAAIVGVNEKELIVVDTEFIEEGWESIKEYTEILRSKKDDKNNLLWPLSKPILFTWDTISSAKSSSEDMGMMYKPRLLREFFRDISMFLSKNNVTVLLLSQVSTGPQGGETPPGGYGIRHHTSIRLKLVGGHYVYNDGYATGINTTVVVIKNKIQPTKGWEADITIDYMNGINNEWSSFNYLLANSIPIVTEYYVSEGYKSCPICRGNKRYEDGSKRKKEVLDCPNCLYVPVEKHGSWIWINGYPAPGEHLSIYSSEFDSLIKSEGVKLINYLDDCVFKTFEKLLEDRFPGTRDKIVEYDKECDDLLL